LFEFVVVVAVPVITTGLFVEEVLFPQPGIATTDSITVASFAFVGGKECISISGH
jgi:hypothetical protein